MMCVLVGVTGQLYGVGSFHPSRDGDLQACLASALTLWGVSATPVLDFALSLVCINVVNPLSLAYFQLSGLLSARLTGCLGPRGSPSSCVFYLSYKCSWRFCKGMGSLS